VTDLETGEAAFVDEHARLLDRPDAPDGPSIRLWDAIVASTSIPIIFPPRRLPEQFGAEDRVWGLPDHHYVDGGLRHYSPISVAVALGATDIIAIGSSPRHLPPVPSGDVAAVPGITGRMIDIF